MEVVYERCAGLDVHKKTVVACLITPEGQETRTFGTMTRELLEMGDWLLGRGVTHVAMESTGVFWKPVYNLLEDELTVLLVNAHHVKALPGRKTDVKDSEWIADLLRHGLLQASFIPSRPHRELRELLRYRRSLVQNRAQMVNRIQKVLEGANIKLSSVATDVVGVSGRAMLQAMVGGEEDPHILAEMAKGSLRGKRSALEEALRGSVGAHQRLLLDSHLRLLDSLDREVERLSAEVERRTAPFEGAIEQLDAIPGMGRRAAEEILGEIGTDMGRFPTAAHLASWAKLCPGNHESAGRRRNTSTGKGNGWLQSTLTEVAHGAVRAKDSYFSALYRRIAPRRGKQRAIIAVAHAILKTIHAMLSTGTPYQDLGPNYFDERNRQHAVNSSVRRLERLGYHVSLTHP